MKRGFYLDTVIKIAVSPLLQQFDARRKERSRKTWRATTASTKPPKQSWQGELAPADVDEMISQWLLAKQVMGMYTHL
jgi:hypothetical protein